MLKESIKNELERIVGKENVLTTPEALKAYSYDGTTSWIHEPDVVVFPTTTQQVSEIVKLANKEKIPVTPRGGGTNVSGGSVPWLGGIVLCTTKMNKILKIDKENLTATVEPGVVLQDLNLTLAKEGLFFPPDPQSFLGATIGGIIAENAGGPACVKYGVTKQYVLGLEVVLPTGEIVNLGGRTLKNVVGYDLLHLFISSEGTLGVITRAELKLNPLPPARKTTMAVYSDVAMAGESVFRVLENGVIPDKIELLDNWVINRIEEMMPLGLPKDADAVLLFECDGIPEAVEKETEKIVDIVKRYGAVDVRIAKDMDEANKYWLARRAGFAAVFGKAKTVLAEDVTVPRGKIPDLIRKCKEVAKKYNVEMCVLGHAGDGNLHPSVLTDITNEEHYSRATKAMDEIIEEAVNLGGVLSGEHGIGLEKQRFLKRQLDPVVIDLMKKIKALLDPNNIMNPGKIWE
ncbi:MAG TPA: FAD-linked oxidase C-terminal domain-containing protein [Syntrophorhabdaceae bacterium]|nr:FAD-linked oxidase C-terminal domain-containing protein [Syntrophorhabdaceae bacterium]HPP06359.1 FAD-linked oxidase C-terminal domain-containing protein [Syntrophorhabdaceae bacterium]